MAAQTPELISPDPRLLGQAELGYDPAVIKFNALPCGQLACTPLEAGCVQTGTDPGQAVIMAGRQMVIAALREEQHLHRGLIERLSVDQKTGIFTYNTQQVFFDRLVESGLLAEMQRRGYIMEVMVYDIDKMKTHNALGAHEGGDQSLITTVERLRPLFRRSSDVMARGLLEHEAAAESAVEGAQGFGSISRFETGDEIIGISFLPPASPRDRRNPITSIDKRARQIVKAMQGATAHYPMITRGDPNELRAQYGKELSFTIEEGTIDAQVSGTFAIALSRVPVTRQDFNDLFRVIDNAMNRLKSTRTKPVTQGVTFSLLPVE